MAWSIALLAVLIGLDQALKYWTVSHLALGESAQLIPGVLQLTRLHNYGAAWSSLSGKTAVLLVITAALMIAVAWLLIKKSCGIPWVSRRDFSSWAVAWAT